MTLLSFSRTMRGLQAEGDQIAKAAHALEHLQREILRSRPLAVGDYPLRDPNPDPYEIEFAKGSNFDVNNHQYNLDPLDDLNEQGYWELGPDEPSQEGDVIIYGIDTNGDGKITYLPANNRFGMNGNQFGAISEVTHSGRVTGVDAQGYASQVTSKWGDRDLYNHHPLDVDRAYGTSRTYYRKRSQ